MCLYINSGIKNPVVKIKPITVYKVFRKNYKGLYKTPVMETVVDKCEGTIMKPRFTTEDKPKNIGLYDYNIINEGFIHSFETVDDCVNFIKSTSIIENGTFYITECKIPANVEHYFGNHYVYSFDDSECIKCGAYASKELVLGKPKYLVTIKREHGKGTPVKPESWKPYNMRKIS